MLKYTFLVYHKEYDSFLTKLRDIGVLHVIGKLEGYSENEDLNRQVQYAARLKSIIRQLEKWIPDKFSPVAADVSVDGNLVLEQTEDLFRRLETLQQRQQQAEREWDRMEVWGNYSRDTLSALKEAGFEVNFFNCNVRKFNQEWEVLYNAFEIDTVGTIRYFVTVTRPGTILDIDADPVVLSAMNAVEIGEELTLIRESIASLRSEISQWAIANLSNLTDYALRVAGGIDLSQVLLDTRSEAGDKLQVLEGWCPEENRTELEEYLNATGIYFESMEPVADEPVPVKLKNNKFARLYETIGELYDLPNYREMDLTPFFAPFFLLFFGLSLGDAAYGLLILGGAIYARFKVKPSMKPIFTLVTWLGASTVVMGVVSGTFFGFNLLEAEIAWLEQFKVIMLNPDQLFYSALIIGVVQILFGMVLKAVGKVRRYGWGASLSSWGWLLIIIGGGATYGLSMLGTIAPEVIKYLYYGFLGAGGLMVFVLNNLKRNPLINIGAGLWDSYNMATGLLGDLLSYIRLFALGISSAVMGFVFNDLAFKMSGDIPVVSTLVMLIILVIGHGINIFMAGLGAFVHPMRLTFVEFYKNAGFEGGGKKYKPFRSYTENQTITK